MRMYEDLKEMLCKELEEITRKGELTAGTLDTVDKLTHAIKSVETIMAMEESGYSRENRHHYDEERESNARGRTGNVRRDSMGRYSRGRGYSYTEAKEDMMTELHELMRDAPDERTKQEFKHFIGRLEEM